RLFGRNHCRAFRDGDVMNLPNTPGIERVAESLTGRQTSLHARVAATVYLLFPGDGTRYPKRREVKLARQMVTDAHLYTPVPRMYLRSQVRASLIRQALGKGQDK